MDYSLTINGHSVATSEMMEIINPATADVLARGPVASRDHLDQAVASAKAAFTGWCRTPIQRRQQCLRAIGDVIEQNAADLARLLTQEQGKPFSDSTREVAGAAGLFRNFAKFNLAAKKVQSDGRDVELHRRPLGVVGAIVPWNFPLSLMAMKVPPALLAGNTVVLKPAPTTPLTTLKFGELVKDILPPGVLNVIAGRDDLGGWLTSHEDVGKVSFTGSSATGAKVMESAAKTLKRMTLELGGNDPAIVLDDANVEEIASKLFQAAFKNNGQTCMAIKRLYVHDGVYDAMCDALASLANNALVADGLSPGTQLGPVHNKTQYEKVLDLIADSRDRGKIIAGGYSLERPGYFIAPTIIRDMAEGSRLVDEEQFGPVLPVIRFSDVDDVIDQANNSPFGLGASIWSSNVDRARNLAGRIEAGTVWINKHCDVSIEIPFGGAKRSGFGVELGEDGLFEFTQLQVINS